MPGRFVYWMNVSADLRIEQVPGEQARFDEGVTLHRYAVRA